MAIIEIRDILNNETGETIFPRTHVNAVIGLKDTSFFEAVQDELDPTKYSVKLKSEYTGLWADGWIAAGGVGSGSGGGGGLIQTVYTWGDIQEMSNAPEDDTASAFNAKTVYEIYKMLQAGGLDGGGYLKESGGGFFLTSSGEKILLKGTGHSLAGLSDVSIYNPALNDLLVWSGYSWVNVPQSSIRPDLSGYVTTATFNSTVANLQEQIDALENFFEVDGSGNITLKSPHQNLWVSGWMAAGGVGTEGGGGGVSFLKELGDVYHNESNVLRADGTGVQPGDALVYDTTHGWVAAVQSSGISSVVLSAGSSNGTLKLTVNGVAGSDVSVPGLGSFAYKNSLSASDIPSLSYLPLSGGELSGDLRLKGSSNYGRTIRFGDGDYAYIKEDTDDHLKIYGDKGIELSTGSGYDVTINGVPLDWFTVVTVDGSPTLKLNPRYVGIWAEGWVSAGGIGSGGGGGGSSSLAGLSDVSLSSPTNGQALVYRSGVWQNETIQGGGGSGSVTSVAMTVPTGLSVSGSPITSSGTLDVSLASGYVIPQQSTLNNFVTLDGTQTITGAKTFTTNPVTIGSDSGLSVNASSYIDIGNARLVYDQVTNALRVANASLYADGFVAAGGIGGDGIIDNTVTQASDHAVKSSGIYSFVTERRWVGTQAQYNALGTYSNDVEYLITES